MPAFYSISLTFLVVNVTTNIIYTRHFYSYLLFNSPIISDIHNVSQVDRMTDYIREVAGTSHYYPTNEKNISLITISLLVEILKDCLDLAFIVYDYRW